MLLDTPDPRYGGCPDPDEERLRRWEPIGMRLLLPAAGSLSCFAISPFTGSTLAGVAVTACGVALCAQFVRVSLRDRPQPKTSVRFVRDERE